MYRKGRNALLCAASALLLVLLPSCTFIEDWISPPHRATLAERSLTGAYGRARMAPVRGEQPGKVRSAAVLPPALLAGPRYRIDKLADRDGFMYHFVLHTDYGSLGAYGMQELGQRLREMPALSKLAAIRTSEHFTESVQQSLSKPLKSALHLVLHPVEAVEAIPGAVERAIDKADRAISRVRQEGSVLLNGSSTQASEKWEDLYEEGLRYSRNYGDRYIGYAAAKRALARASGVDPYSRNALLQRELRRVASAETVGSFALDFIPGLPYVGTLARVNNLIWEKDEQELAAKDYADLRKLNVPSPTVKRFLDNPAFSRSQSTAFVVALEQLKDLPGVADVVAQAAEVDNESLAAAQLEALRMLLQYRSSGGAANRLKLAGGLPAAAGGGALVLALPFDYLIWTPAVAAMAEDAERRAAGGRVTAMVRGSASPQTRAELSGRGWSLNELQRGLSAE